MADNSKQVSELPVTSNVATTDRVLVLRDPSGTPSVSMVPITALSANISLSTSVPANSSANGIAGTIRYDSSYVYICVANNTWKRSALSTW